MCYLIISLLIVFGLTGCQAFGKGRVSGEEPVVDRALTAQAPSAALPTAGPGEPQRGFEQEAQKAQNP